MALKLLIALLFVIGVSLGIPQYPTDKEGDIDTQQDTALTQEQKDSLQQFFEQVGGQIGKEELDKGSGAAIGLNQQCGHSSYDCVPYFQCIDGVINTDGTGLIDVRIRPQATCVNPEYPDVPAVCCLKPGHSATPKPVEGCPGVDKCVDYTQCSKEGYINTDGSGIIDIRTTRTNCYQPDGNVGVCCSPPLPVLLDYCPNNAKCVPLEKCIGQALDVSNKYIDYVSIGTWTPCALKYGKEGICCIAKAPLVLDYCPPNSVCLNPIECLGTAMDWQNNFIPYVAGGKWTDCTRGKNQPYGVCCIKKSVPKPLDYCPTNSVCTLPQACLGTALDGLENFVKYASGSGSWKECYLGKLPAAGYGVCCIPLPPSIIDICPSNSICLPYSSCKGTAMDPGSNFIPYDAKLPSWSQCNLGLNYDPGVCCINPKDPTLEPASQCGIRNYHVDQRIQSNYGENEAAFGEFPWQVIIFYQNYTFNCGASLISNRHVLTAGHCVYDRKPKDIRVRFGEWQVNSFEEKLPYEDSEVSAVYIHPQYNPRNVHNDIAVLELDKPLKLQYHINTVCLPKPGQKFAHGQKCFATGWGKDSFQGKFQHILKKIELPYVEYDLCQNLLRKTRLGRYFQLHKSFICAGGEENRDACYGDGGGPLVCKDPHTGQYVIAGITSWGIGCGTKDVPGVYANVNLFSDWVDEIILGFTNQHGSSSLSGYGK